MCGIGASLPLSLGLWRFLLWALNPEGGLKVMNFPVIRFEGLFPEPSSQLENWALTGLFGYGCGRWCTEHLIGNQEGEWRNGTKKWHDIFKTLTSGFGASGSVYKGDLTSGSYSEEWGISFWVSGCKSSAYPRGEPCEIHLKFELHS